MGILEAKIDYSFILPFTLKRGYKILHKKFQVDWSKIGDIMVIFVMFAKVIILMKGLLQSLVYLLCLGAEGLDRAKRPQPSAGARRWGPLVS